MKILIHEICDFINGGAWSDKEYVEIGIPVLKVSNMQREGIDFSSINYIPFESENKYSKHLLLKDDLVVATVGSHPNLVNSAAGRASIIPKSVEGYLLNQNAACLRTKNSDILNQKYLAYIGKTEHFQHFIQQRGRGAANQMRIAISSIKEFELELPTISIQRRIGSILSSYDDLIENNIRRIKLLEEIAQRTYEEWFVKFRVNGELLSIDKNTELPYDWRIGKIGEIISFQNGFAYKSSRFVEKGSPIIKIKNINNNTVNVFDTDFIDEDYANSTNRFKLYSGDLLIAMTGATIGKVGYIPFSSKNCYLNQRVGRFINLKNKSNIHFIFALFTQGDGLTQVANFASGAAQPNISGDQILNIKTIIPSEDILINYDNIVKNFINQILILQNQNQKLKESREILLPKLMNGSLNIES